MDRTASGACIAQATNCGGAIIGVCSHTPRRKGSAEFFVCRDRMDSRNALLGFLGIQLVLGSLSISQQNPGLYSSSGVGVGVRP